MNTETMFSSKTCEWETPIEFFQELNAKYHFTMDVCATKENAKCEKFFTKEDDGLVQEWQGVCWMNPPYGREIGKWVKKAFDTAEQGRGSVVCLLPARTDTTWWHDYCMKGEITFIRGRLKFGGCNNSAPFPSAIVVFKRKEKEYNQILCLRGIDSEKRKTDDENKNPENAARRIGEYMTDDEVPDVVQTLVAMCRDRGVRISDILRRFAEGAKESV